MPMDETLAVAAIDLSGRPHAVVDLKLKVRAGRRSADRAGARFLRRLRAGRTGQRPREGALRPIEPSPDRSGVQGVRARAARRVLEGPAAGRDAAAHQRTAVTAARIALIDYGAGNLTSVRKALGRGRRRARSRRPTPADLGARRRHRRSRRRPLRRDAALDGAWRDAILGAVGAGVPLLGICLGMQWLFEGSDGGAGRPGLGLLRGHAARLLPPRR